MRNVSSVVLFTQELFIYCYVLTRLETAVRKNSTFPRFSSIDVNYNYVKHLTIQLEIDGEFRVVQL